GALVAVHAAVFPFDGQGAGVADVVQRADDFLEVHAAAAQGTEVPAATRVAEVEVARKDARAAVELDDGVLHVDVVDAVAEAADELDRIDALPEQVARVEVEAELLAAAERLDRPL